MEKIKRLNELVEMLNRASEVYYNENREIISNAEYDKLYEELEALETETGIVKSDSPTVNVGYQVSDMLPKEAHKSKMLSLDKTKDIEALSSWLGDREGLLSWKLDGLTVVITYREGLLEKAITRGNGEIGEVITGNARMFVNIPLKIPFKGTLIVRGEAYIRYSDFERINKMIPELDAKYKNPRNLCSGSVRQLNNRITKERRVNFSVFSVEYAEENGIELDFENSAEKRMEWIAQQGFETVEYVKITGTEISKAVNEFEKKIADMDIPSDGLVLTYEDIRYGISLGNTAKFPRNSIAFKWKDETAETVLREIQWSPSRTGLINPVAVFDPVQLEGTTVSRASVHNVSILKELQLGEGDRITVYKANMIIPQISDNLTRSGNIKIPEKCPVCEGKTEIKSDGDVETLICMNKECPAKKIKSFALFVSRDGMNIENISEATLEKFVEKGFIKEYADIFRLNRYKNQIVSMDGFGEKSYENLIAATEKAKKVSPAALLYSLGIPGIGSANAKVIASAGNQDFSRIITMKKEELTEIDGIGEVMAQSFSEYFEDEKKKNELDELLQLIELEKPKENDNQFLEGMTFVVTGSLEKFESRNYFKKFVEEAGGKVAGSVSSRTDYLVNNDTESSSSKNKKARELGVKIISEEEFINKFNIEI